MADCSFATDASSPAAALMTSGARMPTPTVVDWRGGILLPGFVDTHVHYPQLAHHRAAGPHRCSTGSKHVALPEEAGWPTSAYASERARRFVAALAAHGTTTALVFGAHFAAATAVALRSRRSDGLRMISGLVLSDRFLPSPLAADGRPRISRQHGIDPQVSSPRPAAVRRDAAFCALDKRRDARDVPDARAANMTTCAFNRTSTRTATRSGWSRSSSLGRGLCRRLRSLRTDRNAHGAGAQRPRDGCASSNGSPRPEPQSRIVRRATRRSAAASSHYDDISMRASGWRSERTSAVGRESGC